MPFGKNATPVCPSNLGARDLCGNKWSYAFFVRGSIWDHALFYYYEKAKERQQWKKKKLSKVSDLT